MLTVIHATEGENVYANIISASLLPRGMEAPDRVNTNSVIDVDSAPFDKIEALPDFIKDKITVARDDVP
jgi:hypothetical protein